MKIWGRANSINVMKVLWCADECGLKYEREDVGGAFGGNDQKWYLDMNPNGVVPTIDVGGRIIWESNSAVRYLAAKHAAGTLWPTDPGLRSEADRWMDWQLSTIAEPSTAQGQRGQSNRRASATPKPEPQATQISRLSAVNSTSA